jgi:pyruvate formate-lyase activating enzyme-like uncharacterized protein
MNSTTSCTSANPALAQALDSFDEVERSYVSALEKKGLRFAERGSHETRCHELRELLAKRGARFRNAGASIVCGWLSPACVECTGTGGSETFSTTLRCHRDCYFCFNYNLADYEKYLHEPCPWETELNAAYDATGGKMAVLGLTGGEPLMDFPGTLEFLKRAGELFPDAHKRMYTSGDLLTVDMVEKLVDAGLDEIRFSVKQDDPEDLREKVLSNMELAVGKIPDVVVEMPIIPGTGVAMRKWMRRFDQIGISGMNMLEFCFPFHSWDKFEQRGFSLKNPPFPVMYDYGYSGGLAVAGSEELALELMLFGLDEGLDFGMHYCSLENKHRSEMRQVNEPGRTISPLFEFDEGDFFLKCAKVYGHDVDLARGVLEKAGCSTMARDSEEDSLTFPPSYADEVRKAGATVALASNVIEKDEAGHYLSEVGLEVL